MLACVDEAEVCFGARGSDGEEGGEVLYGQVLRYGHGDCWAGC